MEIDPEDIPAIIGPITTLLAGFGGYWLAQRDARRKEVRDIRRVVYRRALHSITLMTLDTSEALKANDDRFLEKGLRRFEELHADMDMDASRRVRKAYDRLRRKLASPELVKAINEAHAANEQQLDETQQALQAAIARGDEPPSVEITPVVLEFERRIKAALADEWKSFVRAIRKDLKP